MRDTANDRDGWNVRVRKPISLDAAATWTYLLGEGLPLWLGEIESLPTAVGAGYSTRDGVTGVIRGYVHEHRMRLTWRPDDWPHDTILQLSVKASPAAQDVSDGSVVEVRSIIEVHHQGLADRDERRMMLGHWKNVTGSIAERFGEPGARSN